MDRPCLITGPTGSGKSEVALRLAELLNGEIVSFDSMQIYRGMDIGTAKPTLEEREQVRHHLIDIVDPWEDYSLGRFVEDAHAAVGDITRRGKRPLLVGGTGLYIKGYIKGVFEGPSADWELRKELRKRAGREGTIGLHEELAEKDPEAAARIHPNDLRRIVRALEVYYKSGRPISSLQQQFDADKPSGAVFGVIIRRAKEDLERRISERVDRMLQEGLIDEVRRLLAHPKGLGRAARQALGYKEVIEHLEGKLPLPDTRWTIKRNTRRFAKRQMTWFRSFTEFTWLDVAEDEPPDQTAAKIEELLKDAGLPGAGGSS